MFLYHISHEDHGDECEFCPRIPGNRACIEDGVTPRICFAPSLRGCLSAMGRSGLIHVYVPVERPKLICRPYSSTTDVPYKIKDYGHHLGVVEDVEKTEEVWVLEPVKMRRIGMFFVKNIWRPPPPNFRRVVEGRVAYKIKRKPVWPDWIPMFSPDMTLKAAGYAVNAYKSGDVFYMDKGEIRKAMSVIKGSKKQRTL